MESNPQTDGKIVSSHTSPGVTPIRSLFREPGGRHEEESAQTLRQAAAILCQCSDRPKVLTVQRPARIAGLPDGLGSLIEVKEDFLNMPKHGTADRETPF